MTALATARRLPIGCLALLVVLAGCASRGDFPREEAIDVEEAIHYYVRIGAPGSERYEISFAVDHVERDSVEFVMPTWIPGRYDGGRAVIESFSARDGQGRPIATRRLAAGVWRLYPQGEYLAVSYAVVPGAETEPLAFRTQLDRHGGYALGAGLFGLLAGLEGRPVTVSFDVPLGWQVFTALRPSGGNRFSAPRYDDLPGAAFVVGDRILDYRLFVQGHPHQITVQGAGPGFVPDSLLRLVEETVSRGTRFWGRAPYDRYLFAFHFVPPEVGGFGATGQGSSSAFFLPTLDPQRLRDAGLESILLHQYLHAWVPSEFGPTALVRPIWWRAPEGADQWFVEGAAEYYARVLPVRYGGPGRESFYQAMSALLTRWRELGGGDRIDPAALAARARATDDRGPTRLLVGGTIAAFLIDLTIREETRGLRGLDQALYYLQRYAPPEGYDPEVLWPEVAAALGVPASTLGPLTGAGPLSIEAGLSRAGLRAVARRERDALGARLVAGSEGRFVVTDVARGGTAASAGLRDGDVLLKIGPTPVAPDEVVATNFALERYIRGARAGARITFGIERDGVEIEVRGTIRDAYVPRVSLVEETDAPGSALVVRSSLFRPTMPVEGR